MAQFFKAKKSKKENADTFMKVAVDVIDHQGNGLCLSHQPIIVVPGAISGEQYRVQINTKKKRAWYGSIEKVLKANDAARVPAFCPHVNECGGCSHQSFDANFLISAKQASLQTYLKKQINPESLAMCDWQDVIKSDVVDSRHSLAQGQSQFSYRRRARIAIDSRNVEAIKVGFRQEKSNKIVDIKQCAILRPNLQKVYSKLTHLIKSLPSVKAIGHMTLTEGNKMVQVCLHLNQSLCEVSIAMLLKDQLDFKQQDLNIQYAIETKSGKLVSIEGLQSTSFRANSGSDNPAKIRICDIDKLELALSANNFIQVNQSVNKRMLQCALEWLAPSKQDHIVDFFSGIGNFGLALAPYCAEVICVEGIPEMVQAAKDNAQLNGIKNCQFEHFDLNDISQIRTLSIPQNAIFIVDPSRSGALELMKVLAQFKPQKILYVSCSPSSFARDVDVLPNNYKITKLRALDMFPFTKHIELIALISSD